MANASVYSASLLCRATWEGQTATEDREGGRLLEEWKWPSKEKRIEFLNLTENL
jgi:hypothetical protein